MFQIKVNYIYDIALIILVFIALYLIVVSNEKDITNKLLIVIDLMLVIRTITLTKSVNKLIKLQQEDDYNDKPMVVDKLIVKGDIKIDKSS